MPRFGQFLQTRGIVTREQLDEALDHQAVHGARLGTNLVETGAISVERLAEALSEFHRVPLPPRRWLERPKRSALQRVTRSLVDRMRFIPMRVDGNVMHAVLLDPTNPSTLDDLRFATGCRIEPYVLPELWLHDWLFELFKMPPRVRSANGGGSGTEGNAARKRAASVAPLTVGSDDGVAPEFVSNQNAPLSVDAAFPFPARAQGSASQSRPQPYESDAPPDRLPLPPAVPFSDGSWSAGNDPLGVPPNDLIGASVRPPSASLPLGKPNSATTPLEAAVSGVTGMASTASEAVVAFWESSPSEPDTALPADEPAPAPRVSQAPRAEAPPFAAPEPEPAPAATAEPNDAAPATALEAPHFEAAPAPAQHARELAALEDALLHAPDRDALIELAITLAARFAPHVALFVVNQGAAQSLRVAEHGRARALDALMVPLNAPSMLSDQVATPEAKRIDPRERTIDDQLLKDIGDDDALEAALFPIVIKSRVVNVLVASAGSMPLGAVAFAALTAIAQQIGDAYGQLILRRKASTSNA